MIVSNGRFDKIRTKALLHEFEHYEIYRTYSGASLLIVRMELYTKWLNDGLFFLVDPFKHCDQDGIEYVYCLSSAKYSIVPVAFGNAVCNRNQALEFAFALKQMRKVTSVSLYDGIYIEEYQYILPTYTNEQMSDDAVIGVFISGGQNIHFSDSKLSTLFLNDVDYDELSQITGIERKKKMFATEQLPVQSKTDRFVLPGRPELEQFFNEHIINILREPERYKKLGIDFPSSVVLYGPPGCGKTFAVDRLIDYLGLPKFEINSSTIASPYIHDTAKKVAAVFQNAIDSAPSIIVIDEMESYLSNRENLSSNSQHYEEVAEFLRQIQEAQKNKVIIIAMTNMYDKIDPAILRRGRFDHHIEVGLPSENDILELLKSITQKISLSKEVSLEELAKKLVGHSLADVAFVIKEAGLISGKSGDSEISLASIESAVGSLSKKQERRRMGFGSD